MMQTDLSPSVDRRQFLVAAAACTATLASSNQVRAVSANDKLRLAFVGVGGRGGANLAEMTKDPGVEVASICDVNRVTLDRVAERFPSARKYIDLRRLVDDLQDIDAVVVSSMPFALARRQEVRSIMQAC